MSRYKHLAVLPIPIFILLTLILYFTLTGKLSTSFAFEPPLFGTALSIVFISFMSFLVSYMSIRGYLESGAVSLILLGSGFLSFGCGVLIASLVISLPGGVNIAAITHNTGALFGSIIQATGAIMTSSNRIALKDQRPSRSKAILAYLGVLVFMALLTFTAFLGYFPSFFVPGSGPTLLRQFVLGTAVALFAISSLVIMRLYFKTKSDILYWYLMGLALIAVGLSSFLLLKVSGGPISWVGRVADYFGGIYLLVAVITSMRGQRTRADEIIPVTVQST